MSITKCESDLATRRGAERLATLCPLDDPGDVSRRGSSSHVDVPAANRESNRCGEPSYPMAEEVRGLDAGIVTDRETLLVGLADVGLLAGLVLVGLLSHDVNPITEPLYALEATLPFLIGWLVIAPLGGVYGRDALSSLRGAVRVTTVTWIAAANVGLMLRASDLFTGGAVWPFSLVMTGFGLLVLVPWRAAYVAAVGK